MSNLLKETIVRNKLDELLSITTTDVWLDVVWNLLNDIVGYDLSYGEKTIVKNGNNSNILYLDSGPIDSITSVTINDDTKDVSDFIIYNSYGIKYENGYFYKEVITGVPGRRTMSKRFSTDKVEVVAFTGFTASTLPDTIVYAASVLYNIENYMIDNSHIEQKKIDEISWKVKSDSKINGRVIGLLEPYM